MGWLKPTKDPRVKDWQKDKIYLFQYPRIGYIPQISPFSFKLETWIRFFKLDYKNISNEIAFGGRRGQVPFVELNGRQFEDSTFIIEELKKHFNIDCDAHLTTEQRAVDRAFQVLLEKSLFFELLYDRFRSTKLILDEKSFLHYIKGCKKFLFTKLFYKKMQKNALDNCRHQGIGRHPVHEVEELTKRDFTALSQLLGEKPYFFGDKPTTLDAAAFSVVSQFIYVPCTNPDLKTFLEQQTPNLVTFVEKIKNEYWPDWDQLCDNFVMNVEDIPPKVETSDEKTPLNGEDKPKTNGDEQKEEKKQEEQEKDKIEA